MDVVAGHDGMIGAAVEEETRVYAMAHVVVYHPHVVAPLGCDDTVVALTSTVTQTKTRVGLRLYMHTLRMPATKSADRCKWDRSGYMCV